MIKIQCVIFWDIFFIRNILWNLSYTVEVAEDGEVQQRIGEKGEWVISCLMIELA